MSYRDLLLSVKGKRGLVHLLKIVDVGAVIITVCAYMALLVKEGISDHIFALNLALVSAIPFVAVSGIRRLINAPRPYELFDDIYERPPKNKKGCSFPSRHVFSAFSIGTVLCFLYPIVGAVTILLGAVIAAARVLLGKHFLRDVITGALIGAVTSVIGMIIMI